MKSKRVKDSFDKFYESSQWREFRKRVLGDIPNVCMKCGSPDHLQLDHIKTIRSGGDRWDLNNLTLLCRVCHSRKTHLDKGGKEVKKGADADGMPTWSGHPWLEDTNE